MYYIVSWMFESADEFFTIGNRKRTKLDFHWQEFTARGNCDLSRRNGIERYCCTFCFLHNINIPRARHFSPFRNTLRQWYKYLDRLKVIDSKTMRIFEKKLFLYVLSRNKITLTNTITIISTAIKTKLYVSNL